MSLPFYQPPSRQPALYLLVPVAQPFPLLALFAEPDEPFMLPDRRSPAFRAWQEANKKAAPAPVAPEPAPKARMKAAIRVRPHEVEAEVEAEGGEDFVGNVLKGLGIFVVGGALGGIAGWLLAQGGQQVEPQPVVEPVARKKKRCQVAA